MLRPGCWGASQKFTELPPEPRMTWALFGFAPHGPRDRITMRGGAETCHCIGHRMSPCRTQGAMFLEVLIELGGAVPIYGASD